MVDKNAEPMQIVDLTPTVRRIKGHAMTVWQVENALTSLSTALRSSYQCVDVMEILTLMHVLQALLGSTSKPLVLVKPMVVPQELGK